MLSYATYFFSERTFEGSWSNPNVPVLVFKDHSLPGFSVQNHGGPVASGTPVQLLFWGDWWNSDEASARRNLYIRRVQDLLASHYFSELVQYGIAKPTWRGAKIVTEPKPPAAFNSNEDVQAVPDLIVDLIEDDVFPDPDDEKIAFVVFMAKGFTQSIGANGSHTKDYDYEFPWDKDWFWVAWVRFFGNPGAPGGDEDPESAIRTFSHELVEVLSDPELDGWYAGEPSNGEIGDAGATPGSGQKQTAWVNGAQVQAYWSNQYGATVIPIDRDYKARILGTIRPDSRVAEPGLFRPDPEDMKLCNLLPQCCLEQRDYHFTVVKQDETVRLRVETERYRQPQIAWNVEGTPVSADIILSLEVLAGTFEGRHPKFGPRAVQVKCTLLNNELTLKTTGTGANFDIQVTCAVTDGSIVGNLKTNVIATPAISVGFVGAELTDDPDYKRQRDACNKALSDMLKKAGLGKSQKAKIGDPVEFGPAILSDLPAYARLQEYGNARRAVDLSRMAHAFLPPEAATAVRSALVADVPALQAALARHQAPDDGPTDPGTPEICIQIQVHNPHHLPLGGTVDLEFRPQEGGETKNVKGVDASKDIKVSGLQRTPRGIYKVTVTPTDVFKPTAQFVTIPASGFDTVEFIVDRGK